MSKQAHDSRLKKKVTPPTEQAPLAENHPLLEELLARRGQAPVPSGKLASAATAWMLGTFALCYLAIPLALDTGLGGLTFHPGTSGAAFVGMWALVMAGIGLFKPDVRLDGRKDPVIAATLGGLVGWATLHNLLPGLEQFFNMTPWFFGAFLAANVLENLLFGSLLASFTPKRGRAFLLGAGFQVLFLVAAWAMGIGQILF